MAEHRAEALTAVHDLGDRVRPLNLARDRALPVHPLLGGLFADAGLRRGSVVACDGVAALSVALALSTAASQTGSWIAVVGLGSFGMAAAVEWGVVMERVFRVAAPPPGQRATIMAAAADGADVVIASGAGVGPGDARRFTARLATPGGVLLVVGDPGGFSPDLVCRVTSTRWEGLGLGSGRLTARRVTVECAGRRADRVRRVELWFPGPHGTLASVAAEVVELDVARPAARVG